MSLRTNTRTGGLPSNPRSRTNQAQTQAPARDDYYSDAGSRSYDRAGQRDYGSGQSAQRNDRGGGYDDYDRGYASSNAAYNGAGNGGGGGGGGRQDYASSTTTTSSSASSSLLDRMKQRSNVSSARASADDDHNQPQSKSNSLRAGGRSLRAPPQQQQRDPEPDQYYDDGPVPSGEGSSLWGRMVSAAGSLKVNVSTALSNVTREDGEETPPGSDSRLTRAMKEYYLRKARDPNDLPAWLFDDAERRSSARRDAPSSTASSTSRDRARSGAGNEPPPSRSGNLRDIYDRAATGSAASSRSGASSTLTVTTDTGYVGGAGGGLSPSPGLGRSATRAETRLKAMREAKRTQLGGTAVRDNYDAAYRQDSGGGGNGGGGQEDRYSGGRDDRYGGGRDDYGSSRGGGYGGGGGREDPYGGTQDDYGSSRGGYGGGYGDSGYAQDDRYNPPPDDGRRPARVGLPSRPGRA